MTHGWSPRTGERSVAGSLMPCRAGLASGRQSSISRRHRAVWSFLAATLTCTPWRPLSPTPFGKRVAAARDGDGTPWWRPSTNWVALTAYTFAGEVSLWETLEASPGRVRVRHQGLSGNFDRLAQVADGAYPIATALKRARRSRGRTVSPSISIPITALPNGSSTKRNEALSTCWLASRTKASRQRFSRNLLPAADRSRWRPGRPGCFISPSGQVHWS